jgi:hypothetical protein
MLESFEWYSLPMFSVLSPVCHKYTHTVSSSAFENNGNERKVGRWSKLKVNGYAEEVDSEETIHRDCWKL